MIRQASKGGVALHRSPLTLLTCDVGVISQTTQAQLAGLLSEDFSSPQPPHEGETAHLLDLIDPDCFLPTASSTYVDVTIGPKHMLTHPYELHKPVASDMEATTAPSYLP